MPSVSAKQHRFMEAVAHNPKFAKKAGVPQSVGKEFVAADADPIDTYHGAVRRGDANAISTAAKAFNRK